MTCDRPGCVCAGEGAGLGFEVVGATGGVEEVNDSDLLGGGDDLDSFKARKQAAQRQKNEREIRREEILRAREAEREERLAGHRQKEEQTMDMLRALAKQRFG